MITIVKAWRTMRARRRVRAVRCAVCGYRSTGCAYCGLRSRS